MKERMNTIKLLAEVLAYDETCETIKYGGYKVVDLDEIKCIVLNTIGGTFEELNIDTTLQEMAIREIIKGFIRALKETGKAVA